MKNYTETELDDKINAFLAKKGIQSQHAREQKADIHDEGRSVVEWVHDLFTSKISAPLR